MFLVELLFGKLTIVIIIFVSSIFILFFIKKFQRNKDIKKYINKSINEVDKMTGIEFETFLKCHFQNLGFRTETTPATGDYGADLILRKNNEKIIVQAKRYKDKVGIKAIQEVVAAVGHYKAQKGYVVTNSYFTKSAINLANSNSIELWDRKKIIEIMTKDVGLQQKLQQISKEKDEVIKNNKCPWCGNELLKKNGKFGYFIGCSSYPKCKYTNKNNY